MLLAGDIGGTKTLLAIFSREAGPRAPLAQTEFSSRDYPSLTAMAKEFLSVQTSQIDVACFAVAGPVISGRAELTNLTWTVDSLALGRELGLGQVQVMNDLEAVAQAVPSLRGDDLYTLNAGEPVKGGAVAVIAPGTGLGEAFLTWDGTGYRTHPSEGGHADFAPADAEQTRLLEYLRTRFDHVSFERVCSGLGIPNVYDFLRDSGHAPESPELADQLRVAPDRARLILDAALLSRPDALSVATVEQFVSILGNEAANFALKVFATGGVYLAGGIPRVVLPFLKGNGFGEAFRRKGRFEQLLARVPVNVILYRAALVGAAMRGLGPRAAT